MKKSLLYIFLAFIGVCLLSGCDKGNEVKLESDKIYFFYQSTCPHCHHALEYINRAAPDVTLEMFSIEGEGRDLFIECARKFNLPRNSIGTPLICMGDNYIMGWSQSYEVLFDEYVKPYKIK